MNITIYGWSTSCLYAVPQSLSLIVSGLVRSVPR
jgi:hypothetical protein